MTVDRHDAEDVIEGSPLDSADTLADRILVALSKAYDAGKAAGHDGGWDVGGWDVGSEDERARCDEIVREELQPVRLGTCKDSAEVILERILKAIG